MNTTTASFSRKLSVSRQSSFFFLDDLGRRFGAAGVGIGSGAAMGASGVSVMARGLRMVCRKRQGAVLACFLERDVVNAH